MPSTLKISKPLTTHKGVVSEIEFRDMTADDMIEVGAAPMAFITLGTKGASAVTQNARQDQKFEINYPVAAQYFTRLTGIDRILLGSMKGTDFTNCCLHIIGMWNEQEGE